MEAYEWGPNTSIFYRVAKDWVELIKVHESNTLMRLCSRQNISFLDTYLMSSYSTHPSEFNLSFTEWSPPSVCVSYLSLSCQVAPLEDYY